MKQKADNPLNRSEGFLSMKSKVSRILEPNTRKAWYTSPGDLVILEKPGRMMLPALLG